MAPTLRIEPFSGISGDMFLGALAPLLKAEADITALPGRLGLEGVTVQFEDVIRASLACRKATVTLHGEAPEAHPHPHSHSDHSHRAYRDIVDLIGNADLPEGAGTRALDMFRLLGEVEAAMHGTSLEEVHFHEVGGEDALIDLVGAALLLDRLSPGSVICSPVCVGSGTVTTAHGILPVPAPATQKLLEGMPTFPGALEMEMTTPTGAVLLRHLNPEFTSPVLVTTATGLGAGTRDPAHQPNALRLSLCESESSSSRERLVHLETNLDNLPAEDLGADALSALLDVGALDAWLVPVVMKKGRPGHILNVLCHPEQADDLSRSILQSFATLGVRRFEGTRIVLERSSETVSTPYGDILLKVHHLPDGRLRKVPEYESCREAASTHKVPVRVVREAASGL